MPIYYFAALHYIYRNNDAESDPEPSGVSRKKSVVHHYISIRTLCPITVCVVVWACHNSLSAVSHKVVAFLPHAVDEIRCQSVLKEILKPCHNKVLRNRHMIHTTHKYWWTENYSLDSQSKRIYNKNRWEMQSVGVSVCVVTLSVTLGVVFQSNIIPSLKKVNSTLDCSENIIET